MAIKLVMLKNMLQIKDWQTGNKKLKIMTNDGSPWKGNRNLTHDDTAPNSALKQPMNRKLKNLHVLK